MLALALDVRVNKSEFLVARCLSRAIPPVRRMSRCSRVVLSAGHLGDTRGTRSRADHCEFPNVHGRTWSRVAAFWSSWADCIMMIKDRHPVVANVVIDGIARDPAPCLHAVRRCEETAQVWLAARQQDFRRTIPRSTLGRVAATGQGTLEIPVWSVGFSSSHSFAYLQGHAD